MRFALEDFIKSSIKGTNLLGLFASLMENVERINAECVCYVRSDEIPCEMYHLCKE